VGGQQSGTTAAGRSPAALQPRRAPACLAAFPPSRLDGLGAWELPPSFEAEERSRPGTDELLHIVSGRTLLGVARLRQPLSLEAPGAGAAAAPLVAAGGRAAEWLARAAAGGGAALLLGPPASGEGAGEDRGPSAEGLVVAAAALPPTGERPPELTRLQLQQLLGAAADGLAGSAAAGEQAAEGNSCSGSGGGGKSSQGSSSGGGGSACVRLFAALSQQGQEEGDLQALAGEREGEEEGGEEEDGGGGGGREEGEAWATALAAAHRLRTPYDWAPEAPEALVGGDTSGGVLPAGLSPAGAVLQEREDETAGWGGLDSGRSLGAAELLRAWEAREAEAAMAVAATKAAAAVAAAADEEAPHVQQMAACGCQQRGGGGGQHPGTLKMDVSGSGQNVQCIASNRQQSASHVSGEHSSRSAGASDRDAKPGSSGDAERRSGPDSAGTAAGTLPGSTAAASAPQPPPPPQPPGLLSSAAEGLAEGFGEALRGLAGREPLPEAAAAAAVLGSSGAGGGAGSSSHAAGAAAPAADGDSEAAAGGAAGGQRRASRRQQGGARPGGWLRRRAPRPDWNSVRWDFDDTSGPGVTVVEALLGPPDGPRRVAGVAVRDERQEARPIKVGGGVPSPVHTGQRRVARRAGAPPSPPVAPVPWPPRPPGPSRQAYVRGEFVAAVLDHAVLEPFTGETLALVHTSWTPGVTHDLWIYRTARPQPRLLARMRRRSAAAAREGGIRPRRAGGGWPRCCVPASVRWVAFARADSSCKLDAWLGP
jgi:hypothetical protein